MLWSRYRPTADSHIKYVIRADNNPSTLRLWLIIIDGD